MFKSKKKRTAPPHIIRRPLQPTALPLVNDVIFAARALQPCYASGAMADTLRALLEAAEAEAARLRALMQ